jgi:hypothetical protein
MIFSTKLSPAASGASAWIPLLYDTIVFGLTLYRLVPEVLADQPASRNYRNYVVRRLIEDGLLYYAVILAITCTLTVMIAVAPEGEKNIAAQTELL